MKNAIGIAGICTALLTSSFMQPKADSHFTGFSAHELDQIMPAVNAVLQKYHCKDKLLYVNKLDQQSSGKYMGLQGDAFVIQINSTNDTNLLWGVSGKSGDLEGTALHETGHHIFDSLPFTEKKRVYEVFSSVDKSIVGQISKKKLVGHPSFYSFFWFMDEAICSEDWSVKRRFTDEQFAECFTYIEAGQTYQDHDNNFLKKKNAVKEILNNLQCK